MRETPDNITDLKENEVFVFGSNKAGTHGAGAARLARLKFNAMIGVGVGFTGSCYAIPTKDFMIQTMPVRDIRRFVKNFVRSAKLRSHLKFYVTRIGCGLAGYTPADIAPLFLEAIDLKNVYLPRDFWVEIFKNLGGDNG